MNVFLMLEWAWCFGHLMFAAGEFLVVLATVLPMLSLVEAFELFGTCKLHMMWVVSKGQSQQQELILRPLLDSPLCWPSVPLCAWHLLG
jgi:hypothetical protein